jgi:hypothetical protein
MTSSRIRVNAVEFSLGNLTLNGYKPENVLEPNYLSGRQIAQCIDIDESATREKKLSKDLKAMLGNDFTIVQGVYKMKSGGETKINLWTTEQAFIFWTYQATKSWNQKALTLVLACGAESLDRRINRAFGVQLDEEEYNARMKARMEGKITRRQLTDAVADYIKRHNITGNKATFYYKQVTDKIYEGLTGIKTTKKLREKLDVPEKQTPRDYVSDNDLLHIQEVEDTVQRYIDSEDQEPLEAVDQVIRALLLKDSGLTRKLKL